jgi:chemotaxis protein MotB
MPKKKEEEKGKAPSWLTTFGDMNNLLLTFFVLMFTTAEVEGEKMRLILSPFTGGLGPLKGGMTLEAGQFAEMGNSIEKLPSKEKGQKLSTSIDRAISYLSPEIISKRIQVRIDERGVVITIGSDFYFKPGSAELNDDAKEVLQNIFKVLTMIPNLIRVEGHTDNLQIPFGSDLFQKFKDNWELSGERALSVLRYLTDLGLDPSRISYAGYAETRPIESNDTPEGRAYNRRVEIIILREYK